jgi:hypothetical protein
LASSFDEALDAPALFPPIGGIMTVPPVAPAVPALASPALPGAPPEA